MPCPPKASKAITDIALWEGRKRGAASQLQCGSAGPVQIHVCVGSTG